MNRTRHLDILAAAILLAVSFVAAPVAADSWFNVTVAGDNFALGFGAGEWAPYGASWSDPGWSVDYRSSLGGYGEWVWVDGLGSVWRPWVAADWRPYTHGRWVWTSYGWTWVAYEPWGWLPHHYGSWALASAGWVWVPGYEYRPAHVVWVTSGSYVGWYPSAPTGWSHHHRGFRHGYRHGYRDGRHDGYRDGYGDGWDDAMEATWVDRRHVGADDLSRHAVDHGRLSRSGVIAKPAVLTTAPSRVELDRHADRRIPEARVSTRTVELSGRQVVAVRAEGVERDVASHSLATARTALAPAVAERVERQAATAQAARPRSDAADRKPVAQGHTATAPDRKPVAQERKPEVQERKPLTTVPGTSSRRAVEASRPSPTADARDSSARSRPMAVRPTASAAPATRRGVDTSVRRPPAAPTTTRVETEQRSRTVPAPTVRAVPRVEPRTTSASASANRATAKPIVPGSVSRKPSEVKPDDRKVETKAQPKSAAANAPQAKAKGATTKGRR